MSYRFDWQLTHSLNRPLTTLQGYIVIQGNYRCDCHVYINCGLFFLPNTINLELRAVVIRDVTQHYLSSHASNAFDGERINLDLPDYTVGGVLILDARTIHKTGQDRITNTLVTD